VPAAAPAAGLNFAGIGNGFSGPQGTFFVTLTPPDTDGAVGPHDYVQMVNADFAIFTKTGDTIYGPVPTNTLWSGFGGGCETNDDGDGVVRYDALADRWVITQFTSSAPFLECFAVSQTPDPTGAYYRYAFQYADFADYPKIGVWPDAYYATYNLLASRMFLGSLLCALDRHAMLAGLSATQQCVELSQPYGSVQAASLDGSTPPPTGSPEYVVSLGDSTSLVYWRFHVDWTTPANSTLTGPTAIAVASYSPACGSCIPQAGTSQQLDSLGNAVMDRLAYRNFGDHAALVLNDSVTVGSSVGIRWYELRPDASDNLSLFQQGTYAPDSAYRWMGSIATDRNGDIGLGFSESSATMHPAIDYTGRLVGDPPGSMAGEGTIIDGPGSQIDQVMPLSRWGDYTSMSVDPTDDCTFWYTNEYLPADGFAWATRIATFKFPSCGDDFSLTANPSALSVNQGAGTTATISTATTLGNAQSVSLSATGLPAGTTATFSPPSVTSGTNSTLNLTTNMTTPPGTYAINVTGTAASGTRSTSIALTVIANDFSISTSPQSLQVADGAHRAVSIITATTSGSPQPVSLSATGLPAGVSATVNPGTVTSGGSATLTLTAALGTVTGSYPITIIGTGPGATHTTQLTLVIIKAATTLTATPLLSGGMTATLRRADDLAPIAGQTIVFKAGTSRCTATTNSSGTARCGNSVTLLVALLTGRYTATYAGNQSYLGSSASAGLR
jgi:hypothetical protein